MSITEVTPRNVQSAVKAGFERLKKYRKVRAMLIRAYVGQYYQKEFGLTGEAPLNLLYSAIRTIVPNIVNNNPVCSVVTDILDFKPYAEIQSLALTKINRDINIKAMLRAATVSAMFAMAIAKTSIASSGVTLEADGSRLDPGQLYTELLDLDDFVMSSDCMLIMSSPFLGHRIATPRQHLLDTDGYDHDLVKKLPTIESMSINGEKRVSEITGNIGEEDLEDKVHVVELWVPKAKAIVTIPDPYETTFDKYIGLGDYYGPDSGPYSFLSFTPPVDGNPLPVSPTSMIFDLHRSSNAIFRKILDQAERQKDVLLYDPAHSDVAQDILNAEDGGTIASSNPQAINSLSVGGANKDNSDMLQQLQLWFNYMAGNPDQMSGARSNAKTATQANILESNASISVEDSKSLLYDFTADIANKQRWYLHYDPLIDMLLAKRKSGGEYVQLKLTPEQRTGEYIDFITKIVPKSMTIIDPQLRTKMIMEFCTNIIPQAAMTLQTMMQVGQPFNITAYLTSVAEEMGITDWVQDLFVDPGFDQRMQLIQSMGPQNPGKAGSMGMNTTQNGGFPVQRTVNAQPTLQQGAQQGAQMPGGQMNPPMMGV
jgi:hypothetical protein